MMQDMGQPPRPALWHHLTGWFEPRTAMPTDTLVCAVGDIHGRADLLARLHRLIEREAQQRDVVTRRIVIYIGDYLDPGPASRETLDLLIGERPQRFETVHLKGNHEDAQLRFLENPQEGPAWW